MPIPLILGAAAVALGGYGAKKGLDAKEDFEYAKSINNRAKRTVKSADENLESAREATQKSLQVLGKRKIDAFQQKLKPWKSVIDTFKNVDLSKVVIAEDKDFDLEEVIVNLRDIEISISEMGAGAATSAGAGAVAGFAAYGSVQALAAASTGTAISSLSGAAATNATLAWLGGGSLATGGMGMAGGTAVLGGVVAGPVLAIGGMMLASKAEAAVDDAKANERKADAYAKQKKVATLATKRIQSASEDVDSLLVELMTRIEEVTVRLEEISYIEKDYKKLVKGEKQVIANSMLLAKLLSEVVRSQLLSEDGSVSASIKDLITDTHQTINKINSVA